MKPTGMQDSLDRAIAAALRIDPQRVCATLSYQSIPEWNSMGHVELMLALESVLGRRISEEQVVSLTSVAEIRNFAESSPAGQGPVVDADSQPRSSQIRRGLDGVLFDETRITDLDVANQSIRYRGYAVEQLLSCSSFEESSFLLLHGELPTAQALSSYAAQLHDLREPPAQILSLVDSLRAAHPMSVLRTAVSALGATEKGDRDSREAHARAGLRLIATIPWLVGWHDCARSGRAWKSPSRSASHSEYLLELLCREPPRQAAVDFLNQDLILHADHGSCASTFTARIAVGCRSDTYAAVVAALAAFAGPLHGGAVEKMTAIVDEIGAPERALAYVQERFGRREPIIGFGHRVYKSDDPRVAPMRRAARALSQLMGSTRDIEIVEALEQAMRPYARHGMAANVDLYAGIAYRLLGIADDLATAIFSAGRIVGWVAHIQEQFDHNVLIRPQLQYVGSKPRSHPNLQTAGAP